MRPRTLAALLALPAALLFAGSAPAITNPQIPGLQVALKEKGFYTGEIDGVAGPLTAKAVRRFQRKAGLTVDGVAGPQTRKALGRLGRPLFGKRLVISRGMVGWDVSVLEFFLVQRGGNPGKVDGRFTHRTERALRAYQKRKRLSVDGVAGRRTLRTFGVRTGKSPRPARLVSRGRSVEESLSYWAGQYGVSPSLVRALAWMESGFQANVTSPAGAWGVMQVAPETWRYVELFLIGHRVRRTIDANIRVGVAYLHQLLHEFRFDARLALAAYYQGSSAVRKRGLYGETKRFVRDVLALQRRFSV
jgi:peptidoglycan hydrolase-like protein with peptidoglycan-binding domain